jgi:hypothetical protein
VVKPDACGKEVSNETGRIKSGFENTCTYCGKPGADSEDHVPPKQLLPKPLASYPKPIIVLAHQACNAGFRKDDEYFCSLILSTRDVHPAADEPLSRFLKGIWKPQNEKFRKKLQAEAIPTGIYGPDGEEIHRFKKEGKRVDRVLGRIVQGIARFDFKIPHIDPVRISIIKGHVDWSLFDKQHGVLGRVAYTNAFRFFCQFDPEDTLRSTWLLVFYEKISFQVSVLGKR